MTPWLTWLRKASADTSADASVAMITVLASEGSVPRGAGTRMLVGAELHGTIGGGKLEYCAIEQARALLDQPPGSWRVQDYPLGPLLGQCCGGRVRLLIEHLDPAGLGWLAAAREDDVLVTTLTPTRVERRVGHHAASCRISARGERPAAGTTLVEALRQYRRPLYLFGAGHVGQAIVRHAERLPFRLAWFDTRAALAAADGVTVIDDGAVEQCVVAAPDDAAIVILTHDHVLDYRLTRTALSRTHTAFVGLIGSATKRARFVARLERDGIGVAARARLTSPIGIAGVTGKEPDVIAVATLAQLLQLAPP